MASTIEPERTLGGLTKIFSKIEASGIIDHFTGATYIGFGDYIQDPEFQNAPNSISEGCQQLNRTWIQLQELMPKLFLTNGGSVSEHV
ncbi:MAG TPA: hypothetical protein DIT94_09815, partial [Deltaproteobacteria bacterium]|nr:hypothetical protein [Deltaproteobacteria bacterium]